MLFVWMGLLKDGAEPDQQVQEDTTGFLEQPLIAIRAAGALRDEQGRRAGMMMIFEADDRSAAEALVGNSPYQRAGLYQEHRLFEYQNEIG
ncbi:MAG TPA: YciI family protein [Sphingomicrobium sp.]